MTTRPPRPGARRQRGTSLLEVLITMIILAFGLLGVAAFHAKAQVGTIESYQRAQAVVLLADMRARLTGNAANAADYAGATLGTGDSEPADCGAVAPRSARDRCEWSLELKGAAEQKGAVNVGAMQDARGCVSQVQAPDASAGVCIPGVYLLAVAWQGAHKTRAPALDCGKDLYGDDGNRRAIATRVTIGLPSCS